MYTSVDKLIQIKNEYDNEDKKFIEDHNIKKGRGALKYFINDVIDEKLTKKEDLIDEYLKKVKIYEDKLKERNRYAGSNFKKLLEFIERVEFAVFGPDFLKKIPKESEKLDITQGGENIRDQSPLKSEEDAAKRQQKEDKTKIIKRKGLKIMKPKQMITRLPILLAQLKLANNSQKLKNEIRQIICSLYRSKNLSKTTYNYLINNIQKWRQYSLALKIAKQLILIDSDFILQKKMDLRGNKTIVLADLSICTWQNIKEEYKNNKFKLSEPT